MEFEITNVKKLFVPSSHNDIVGEWSANFGPFRIRRGYIIRPRDGRPVLAAVAGREERSGGGKSAPSRGVTMVPGPERDALCAAALAAWEAL